jgi:outer membrane protein OmpA-like peptidoglycan-associated protein
MKTLPLLIALLSLTSALVAADPGIISAEELGKKWKRTKSITAPVEKLRKGLTVETGGAPAQTMEVKVDADTEERFQNIQFALDSDRLEGAATFAQLTEIAKAMQMAGTEKFLIEGHTCDLGDGGHNLGLSQKRALAVKAYLAGQGVAPERLQIIGFGPQDPLVANTSEPARQQNRRVQIFRKL